MGDPNPCRRRSISTRDGCPRGATGAQGHPLIVVSDTNILSSLAAGDSLGALLRLFARSTLWIPPSVQDELQMGLDKGRTYLEPIFRALTTQHIDGITRPRKSNCLTLPQVES